MSRTPKLPLPALLDALERNAYNVSAAADDLGVSRTTIYSTLTHYGYTLTLSLKRLNEKDVGEIEKNM